MLGVADEPVTRVGATPTSRCRAAWPVRLNREDRIATNAAAVTQRLRAEDNLSALGDPGQWSDRAGRVLGGLPAIHTLAKETAEGSGCGRATCPRPWGTSWNTRGWPERNVHLAVAVGNGGLRPVACPAQCWRRREGVSIDRENTALDDTDKNSLRRRRGKAERTPRAGHRLVTHEEVVTVLKHDEKGCPERCAS